MLSRAWGPVHFEACCSPSLLSAHLGASHPQPLLSPALDALMLSSPESPEHFPSPVWATRAHVMQAQGWTPGLESSVMREP